MFRYEMENPGLQGSLKKVISMIQVGRRGSSTLLVMVGLVGSAMFWIEIFEDFVLVCLCAFVGEVRVEGAQHDGVLVLGYLGCKAPLSRLNRHT